MESAPGVFDQSPHRIRCEWGLRGAVQAASRGDVVVIVDVLSFSTTVVAALEAGAMVIPCDPSCDQQALAEQHGAELAVKRDLVPAQGRYSLSPLSFSGCTPGMKIVIPSPNGAACSAAATSTDVLIGALGNATAVAEALTEYLNEGRTVTVVPCGERWADGSMRMAIEDYMGAGAILHRLSGVPSPEAEVCARTYTASQERLIELIWDCGSGRELRARGYGDDVRYATEVDRSRVVPVMREGILGPR